MRLIGEQCKARDIRKSYKENHLENNRKNDARNRAKIAIIDTNEESQIREYANIKEIKEMNNMLFYKNLIKCLVNEQVNGKCNNLCCIKDRVLMYQDYKESEDIFVKMGRMLCMAKKRLYGYNCIKYR